MDNPPESTEPGHDYWYTGDGPTDDVRRRRKGGGVRKSIGKGPLRTVRKSRTSLNSRKAQRRRST